MARKLEVEIVGDAGSLRKALGQADSGASKFGSTVKSLGKAAAFSAGAAGVGALFVTLKAGIGEYKQAQTVGAQTNAVIKSTGQVANVSAKHVDALGTSIMKKSGFDDEAVKSGENLLLTFTNIHNEVGKGNKIFDQATKVTADLSVAFHKDLNQSAILVGKALNDPVKGLTALGRVGIQFTAGQKKTIKSLVDTGHTLDAQKMILKELNKQVGGSADAFGKTLPGMIAIARESFNNWAGDMVSKAIPAVTSFFGFVKKVIAAPTISLKLALVGDELKALGEKIRSGVQQAIANVNWKSVGTQLSTAISAGLTFTDATLSKLFTTTLDWVNANAPKFAELGVVIALNIVNTLMDPVFWIKHWQILLVIAATIFGRGVVAELGNAAKLAITAFRLRFLTGITLAATEAIARLVAVLPGGVLRVAEVVAGILTRVIGSGLGELSRNLTKIPALIKDAFKVGAVLVFYGSILKAVGALKDLYNWLKNLVTKAWDIVVNVKIHTPSVGGILDAVTKHIPGRALGGTVKTGHGYIVGERGPEFFSPGSSGTIIPNGRLGGGAQVIKLYIDGREFASAMIDPLRSEARLVSDRTGRPAFG